MSKAEGRCVPSSWEIANTRIAELGDENERLESENSILRQECDENDLIIANLETSLERMIKKYER